MASDIVTDNANFFCSKCFRFPYFDSWYKHACQHCRESDGSPIDADDPVIMRVGDALRNPVIWAMVRKSNPEVEFRIGP